MLNGSYVAWTRGEVPQRRRPTRRIQNRLDTQLDMKKVAFYSKPLDDSNGSIKVTHNKAMQTASQTTESPETAKKRLGLLAVLAVGVNAAASFLKSKMEKAAAVASQVGAAVLKSKKAVSAAFTAILGAIWPKPQKIAEKHFAKGKARLASASILALLAGIFIAQNQGMATRGILVQSAPSYLEVSGYVYYRYGRSYQHRTEYRRDYSNVLAPSSAFFTRSGLLATAFKEWGQGTSHWTRIESYYYRGRVVSYKLQRDPNSHRGRGLLSGITHEDATVYLHLKEGGYDTIVKDGFEHPTMGTLDKWIDRRYWIDFYVPATENTWDEPQIEVETQLVAIDESVAEGQPGHSGICEGPTFSYPGNSRIRISPCDGPEGMRGARVLKYYVVLDPANYDPPMVPR